MTELMGIKLEFISELYELNISGRKRHAEEESGEEEEPCWQLLVGPSPWGDVIPNLLVGGG